MPRRQVESTAEIAAAPDDVWTALRGFCAAWHPAVDEMAAGHTARGGLVRRFTVKGETTLYRERLTYFSDSQRQMRYTHVEGIAGVETYNGALSVTAHGEGSRVMMRAEIAAPNPRLDEIAAGTQMVFDLGTKAIAAMTFPKGQGIGPSTPEETPSFETRIIQGPPDLALSIAGAPSDTLCLFLHGIGGNRSNWERQLAAAAPLCQTAALDLRGYGDSALGPAQSTVEDYCADILRVVQAMGNKRLILCGLSYGAWIATSFAMRHPDKLRALILAGGCTGMSEASPEERDAFRQSREVPLANGQTPADFAPAVVDVIAGPQATEANRADLLASMASIPVETYADALRCFTTPKETFDFARLNLPVLMMTGEHDRLAPPKEIGSVAERIWQNASAPDVRFEIIPGAGHVCNLEQPKAFNQTLTAFLERVLA